MLKPPRHAGFIPAIHVFFLPTAMTPICPVIGEMIEGCLTQSGAPDAARHAMPLRRAGAAQDRASLSRFCEAALTRRIAPGTRAQ
jgi:hypothetical protein